MSRRFLAALAGAFASLLLIWGLSRLLVRGPEERPLLWPEGRTVTRLQIGTDVELVRESGGWKAVRPLSYPAEETAIADVLERLPKVRVSDYLTDNPAKHALFAVAGDKGLRLTVFSGEDKPALDLLIGKSGTTYDVFYFRRADGDKVFEAQGLPRYLLDRAPLAWLSRQILSVESDRVRSLTVKSSTGTLKLERKGGKWLLAGAGVPEPAVKKLIEPMMVALVRLEADAVVASSAVSRGAFSKPALQLDLAYTDRDGKAQEVRFKAAPKKELGQFYLRREGEDRVVYELSTWKLEPFRKSPRDFKSAG